MPRTDWCCLVTESQIRYRTPGDLILYYMNNTTLKCETGWAGRNCEACAPNFGPPGRCDQCLPRWAGENCDSCAVGWDGRNCESCAPGWTGPECSACEGFGFSAESNCTECIQNGYWAGTFLNNVWTMTAYLTFERPACSDLVPGM